MTLKEKYKDHSTRTHLYIYINFLSHFLLLLLLLRFVLERAPKPKETKKIERKNKLRFIQTNKFIL
jgi:hypothetical protein